MTQRLHIHIERLVMCGVPAVDPRSVGEAIARHVSALVTDGGVRARTAVIPHVDGGAFRLAHAATAESIGANIARAVHTGVRR